MAEVLLFHHVQGQTPGVLAFAEELRAVGHTVHAPDLFNGRTFATIPEGMDYAFNQLGFQTMMDRGKAAADALPQQLVYAGFSMGVMPAQLLTQTRPGARGALFYHSCAPVAEFGTWPEDVPVQIHSMDRDPYFVDEGDIDAAKELLAGPTSGELFLYPGDEHLFADSSLAAYNPELAALLMNRTLAFLQQV